MAAAIGPAAAAAPATGGMSLLLPLLMSFGPGIISKLFGGRSPSDQLKDQINQLLDPNNQSALRAAFLRNNINSPAFTQGQNAIATGANQTANAMAEKMGAHGITPSGTSDVLSSMGPSLVGNNQAQLYSAADKSAQDQTDQATQAKIAAIYKMFGQVDPTQQYMAAGINNFQPYLTNWLKSNYPNMFSGVAGGGGNAGTVPTPGSSSTYKAPAQAQAQAPTNALGNLYAPNNPGASALMNPTAMSMMSPGNSDAGLFGTNSGHEWTPPAVKVGGRA